jgi:hypothetical protein
VHAGQFADLLKAIDRNTDAQLEHAKAVHRLADECVTLATMLADVDPEDAPPAVDMAGRPIAD